MTIALTETGYVERGGTGNNGNITKYWADLQPGFQGSPWCATFTTWCVWRATGVRLDRFYKAYYTPSAVNYARQAGAWKVESPLPADQPMFDFPGGDFVDHTGLTVDGLKAIEGNASPTNAGSQNNGGGVYVRTRPRRVIAGWIDTAELLRRIGFPVDSYGAGKAGAGVLVQQRGRYLTVSGKLNSGTVTVLQRYLIVSVDGELGPVTTAALQRLVGVEPDGEFGALSARAAEVYFKILTTTVPGWYPGLVRAVQRYLNTLIAAGTL